MKLLITLAIIFIVLNLGIWGLYFFGDKMIKIPDIQPVPKELTFEKPNTEIKLDLPIPEGEKVVIAKKGNTRGLQSLETMVVAQEANKSTYHVMIFDSNKTLLFERKNDLVAPNKISLQTFNSDKNISFHLDFTNNISGYFLRWNGFLYTSPENEFGLSSR